MLMCNCSHLEFRAEAETDADVVLRLQRRAFWEELVLLLEAVAVLYHIIYILEEAVVRTVVQVNLDGAAVEVVVGSCLDAYLEVLVGALEP